MTGYEGYNIALMARVGEGRLNAVPLVGISCGMRHSPEALNEQRCQLIENSLFSGIQPSKIQKFYNGTMELRDIVGVPTNDELKTAQTKLVLEVIDNKATYQIGTLKGSLEMSSTAHAEPGH